MDNNYEISLIYEGLKIKVKNLKISCYGAIGLMDFDFYFDLEITSANNKFLIRQEFSEDIAYLFEFCDGKSHLTGNDACSFGFNDCGRGYQIFEFNTENLSFSKRIINDLDRLREFKIELKAYFEMLIDQYIKTHPEE